MSPCPLGSARIEPPALRLLGEPLPRGAVKLIKEMATT